MTWVSTRRGMPGGMTAVWSGLAVDPVLPLINMGNHSTALSVDMFGGAPNGMAVSMFGASFGFIFFSVSTNPDPDNHCIWNLDGTTVIDGFPSGNWPPIIALPPATQSNQVSVNESRVFYQQEYVSDNGGTGGSTFLPPNVYEWRWTLLSGTAPSTTTGASPGVWVNVGPSNSGVWRWNASSFAAQMQIEVRDAFDIIVGTSIIDVSMALL